LKLAAAAPEHELLDRRWLWLRAAAQPLAHRWRDDVMGTVHVADRKGDDQLRDTTDEEVLPKRPVKGQQMLGTVRDARYDAFAALPRQIALIDPAESLIAGDGFLPVVVQRYGQ
jgi:hypothetical protein